MFMLTAYRVLLCEFFWEFSIFRFCRPLVDIYWHPLLISFQTTNCIPWSQRFFLIFLRENLGTNCIKACSPVRSSWTDKEQLHTESPNFGPRVVNTRPWRHYPNMGSYLHPNMVKNANFRGLRRIWEFLPTLRGVIILPPRQPRFLAWLPRWQLICLIRFSSSKRVLL